MRVGLIGFIVFCFIGLTLLDSVMLGQGGIISTGLTSTISATATTIPADTSGFPAATITSPQVIVIENEQIAYYSYTPTAFLIPANGRGANNTAKAVHSEGKYVYTEEAQMVNETLGFQVVQPGTTVGGLDIAWSSLGFLRHSLPNMLYWNFSFLTGPAQYIALFLKAFSAAIAIGVTILFISSIYGLLKP